MNQPIHSRLRVLSAVAVSVLAAVAWMGSAGAGDIMVPDAGKSQTIDQIRDQGELRVGIAVQVPWLGQDPNTGQYFGASYEVGQRVAQEIGVPIKPISSGWDVIVAGLQGNQFELAIAPLFGTEKRRKVIDFVEYTASGTCYAVLEDNDKVNTLDDMNQKSVRIGTYTGTGTEHIIVAKYTDATINSVVQQVAGATRVEDLLTKRIDVAPFDHPLAFVLAEEYPQIKIIPGGPEHCVNNVDLPTAISMGLNYGDPEFKKFLEAVVVDMKSQIEASIVKFSATKYMKQ